MTPANRRPIFLQTGFRTGGTWLWSCFRACPETRAFCEPLNEALVTITPDAIRGLTAHTSGLNHPTLDLPYFHEYLPLLNTTGIGVTHFRAGFGLQLYLDPPQQQPPALAIYLQHLLSHSRQQSRQPVLKFARALGRARWLRQHFPDACQIVLTRDPWSQFCSGCRLAQRHQNHTFLMIPLFVISRPRTGPIRAIADRLGIPHIPFSDGIGACAAAYIDLAQTLPAPSLFAAFLTMAITSHAASIPIADLVINQEQLAEHTPYRRAIEHRILALCGTAVSLDSIRPPTIPPDRPAAPLRAIADEVFATLAADYAGAVAALHRQLGHPPAPRYGHATT